MLEFVFSFSRYKKYLKKIDINDVKHESMSLSLTSIE